MAQPDKKSQPQTRKQRFIRYFKKTVPILGIFILIFLIVDIGAEKIIATFLKISPIYVVAAAALTFPRLLIRNTQWQFLLKKYAMAISPKKTEGTSKFREIVEDLFDRVFLWLGNAWLSWTNDTNSIYERCNERAAGEAICEFNY